MSASNRVARQQVMIVMLNIQLLKVCLMGVILNLV